MRVHSDAWGISIWNDFLKIACGGPGWISLGCVGALVLKSRVQAELCHARGAVAKALTPRCDLIGL